MIVIIMMVMVKVVVVLLNIGESNDVDISRWVWRFAGRKALLGGRSLRKRHTGETNKQKQSRGQKTFLVFLFPKPSVLHLSEGKSFYKLGKGRIMWKI